jgi:hypothetical protein
MALFALLVAFLILFVLLEPTPAPFGGFIPDFPTAWVGWNGVICAGVILSVMGGVLFFNVLGATNPWPVC